MLQLHLNVILVCLFALPTFSTITSKQLTPFPASIRMTSPCPCVCQVVPPKGVDLCASVPHPQCKMMRCVPRQSGFTCCEDGAPQVSPTATPSPTPIPPPKKARDVTPNVFRIQRNGKAAGLSEPELAAKAQQILLKCKFDLEDLIEPKFTTRTYLRDTFRMRKRTLRTPFVKYIDAVDKILLFTISSLKLH